MIELSLAPEDVERRLAEARRRLARSGLPELLSSVDGGGFGTTPLNLQILEAVSRALASAEAVLALPEAPRLPAPYAAVVFAEEAALALGALGDRRDPPERALIPHGPYGDRDARGLLEETLKDLAGFVRFYGAHPEGAKRLARDADSLACAGSFFTILARTLRRLSPDAPEARLRTPSLLLNGYRPSPAPGQEPDALLDVSFDDIVGNEEYVKAGRRLARDVAGFDLKAGKNPKAVRNQVLFVLGAPGSGKTVTAHAIGRHFLDLCRQAGLPGRFRVIRRTDWASSYQNQSASNLLRIFNEEIFSAPGVAAAYWPDIDTAFAARSDSDIRQEEKSNLGALFGILDGTVGPRNGRWFLICDANSLHMDSATLSRVSQNPLKAPGPSRPEDFARLIRDVKLKRHGGWLKASPEDWARIGERCAAERLSGRAADHLAGRILAEIEDFEEPEGYFALPFDEKVKMIDSLRRTVDAGRILGMIEDYCRFERDAHRKAEEERFLGRVSEIRFHLAAQAAARASAGA